MACMGACMQVKFNCWRGLDAWPVDSLVGERHVVDNGLGWGWGHPSTSTCQIGHTTPMQHSPGAAEKGSQPFGISLQFYYILRISLHF